jgi:hypothetical protein
MENNINISLDKTIEIKCNQCDNNTFIEGVMLRKVSKFLVGSPQDALIPIQIMICSKCQTPLEETLPIQLKQLQNAE